MGLAWAIVCVDGVASGDVFSEFHGATPTGPEIGKRVDVSEADAKQEAEKEAKRYDQKYADAMPTGSRVSHPVRYCGGAPHTVVGYEDVRRDFAEGTAPVGRRGTPRPIQDRFQDKRTREYREGRKVDPARIVELIMNAYAITDKPEVTDTVRLAAFPVVLRYLLDRDE
jgi:hypothetical protein